MSDRKITNILKGVQRGLFESPLLTATARGIRRKVRYEKGPGNNEEEDSINTQEEEEERVVKKDESSSSSSSSESDSDWTDPSDGTSSESSCGSDWSNMGEKAKTLYWDGKRSTFEDFWEDFEIRAVKKKFEEHVKKGDTQRTPRKRRGRRLRASIQR